MKKTVTTLSFSANGMMSRLALALLLFAFSSAVAFGQSNDFREEIGDLSSIVWKTSTGIDVVVAEENARLAVVLSQPGLQQQDRSLFLSYQRLVGYVQSAAQAGTPLDAAIFKSYEKVLAEVPHDVNLKHLPDGALMTLVPGLLELLSQVPTPEILIGQ
ncbi:MAG: hypothetical protein IPM98_00250 [Lewinellaceae bacterium]|nr:hypothetical protein [Lewinellaceae bacterium]